MNTSRQRVPIFYDCEASSVEGFPIEIGWAFLDEAANVISSEGHLIRSASGWDMEADWDPEAEKLHKITRLELSKLGEWPREVAKRMNSVLAGQSLYSDSLMDEVWLRMLFDEAGLDPTFTVWRTDARVLIRRIADARGYTAERLAALGATANRLAPRTHHAADDARHLATLWRVVTTGDGLTAVTDSIGRRVSNRTSG